MNQEQWKHLEKVNNYLHSKTTAAVAAFKELDKLVKAEKATMVVIAFTYEHLEALGKVDDEFKMYKSLFDVLSNDHISDLMRYEYDENKPWEDYQYWKLHDLAFDLVEMWIAQCFDQAGIYEENGIPYYYKQNYDSMEILELGINKTRMEKSEFETHYSLNKERTLDLIRMG